MNTAIKLCCESGHTGKYANLGPVRDSMIIPLVKAAITYCDIQISRCPFGNSASCHCPASRFAAAADRLRDFATVELLCEGLGITRKDLN